MTTLESPKVTQLWKRIHELEPRAKFGGSVGDRAHAMESHTYHMSYDDQRHDGGYSVHYASDRLLIPRTSRQYASAIDITLPPDLMRKYTGRLVRWAESGRRSLDLFGIMEFAGTLDHHNVIAYDTHSNKCYQTFGWDDSHLWHIHISIARRRINDPRILSIAEVFA